MSAQSEPPLITPISLVASVRGNLMFCCMFTPENLVKEGYLWVYFSMCSLLRQQVRKPTALTLCGLVDVHVPTV